MLILGFGWWYALPTPIKSFQVMLHTLWTYFFFFSLFFSQYICTPIGTCNMFFSTVSVLPLLGANMFPFERIAIEHNCPWCKQIPLQNPPGLTFSAPKFFYHSSHVFCSLWRYCYSVYLLTSQLTAGSLILWRNGLATQYLLLKALYWKKKTHIWTIILRAYCPHLWVFVFYFFFSSI